jgi:fructose-1,6-bisphosphatase/inositol monophosphatase family enzyme
MPLLDLPEAVSVLKDMAREAGTIAADLQRRSLQVDLKEDASVVSNGDLAAEKRAFEVLAERVPGTPVVSEETPVGQLPPEHFLVVDPIDGTADYVNGGTRWGVLGAYVVAGRAVAGVIYQPALERLIWGGEGLGCFVELEGRVSPVSPRDPGVPLDQLVMGTEFGPWLKSLPSGFMEGLLRGFRFVRANGSAADGLAEFLLGQTTGYIHVQGAKVWDMAPGAALARALGGGAVELGGNDLLHHGIDCSALVARSPAQALEILRQLGFPVR